MNIRTDVPPARNAEASESARAIGPAIRAARLSRGLSQRDIERRTGCLCCYLSKVENGHIVPSIETIAKIAAAMEMHIQDLFTPAAARVIAAAVPDLSPEDLSFLIQVNRYAGRLSSSDRNILLALVRKFAGGASAAVVTKDTSPSARLT